MIWNFNTPGQVNYPPDEWQLETGDGTIPDNSFRVITFAPEPSPIGEENLYGVVRIQTDADTLQRHKIKTLDGDFSIGIYAWRIYIPKIEYRIVDGIREGTNVSVGAFLASDDTPSRDHPREIDFEVFYGTNELRSPYVSADSDSLICHMTIQRDSITRTTHSVETFPRAGTSEEILPENWYTFSIELKENKQGFYLVSWYIQKEGEPRIKARSDGKTRYGPANTGFNIYCSLENLESMNALNTTRNHSVHFDWVTHCNHSDEICHAPIFAAKSGLDCLMSNFLLSIILIWLQLGLLFALLFGMDYSTLRCRIETLKFQIKHCKEGNTNPCIEL